MLDKQTTSIVTTILVTTVVKKQAKHTTPEEPPSVRFVENIVAVLAVAMSAQWRVSAK